MRRVIAFLLVFGMVAAPAFGHDRKSKDWDQHDTDAELDLKWAKFQHDDTVMYVTLETHRGFTNSFLKRKPFFAFHIWKAGKKPWYRVAVFRHRYLSKWVARIIYFTSNSDSRGDVIGHGNARRESSNEVSFTFKRSIADMGGSTHLRWRSLGIWCADQDCDEFDFDDAPTRGSKAHFMAAG